MSPLKKGLTNALDRAEEERKQRRRALRDRLDLSHELRADAKERNKMRHETSVPEPDPTPDPTPAPDDDDGDETAS